MTSFDELAASRRQWIAEVLEPWCRQAARRDLLRAAAEWGNFAGRVDVQATLWTWAWSRFPVLVHEGLSGVDETREVRVVVADGREFSGWPDNRRSIDGQLRLVAQDGTDLGPFSIDDIREVSAG